jgi:hypothetical protein
MNSKADVQRPRRCSERLARRLRWSRALAPGARVHVELEALIEAEVRRDPTVAPDSRRAVARLAEAFRGKYRLGG